MLAERFGCCVSSVVDCCIGSVVDCDISEREGDGGSAGAAHSEREDGSWVVFGVVGVVSAVDSS